MHKTIKHLCRDGSDTLYSEKFKQHYHNPNGAIAESRHLFFDTPGLQNRLEKADTYQIFELGFGTGLNLLLLLEMACKLDPMPVIHYRTVEAFPLTLESVMKLNYPEKIDLPNTAEILASTFRDLKPGFNDFVFKKNIHLELYYGPFDKMPAPDQKLQSVIFDPFSTEVNPELWTDNVFRKLISWSNEDVILSTYGAASSARAAMCAAGWCVAKAPGALGKREMTLAARNAKFLSDWKRVDEKKLSARYQRGEFS